MGFLIFLLLILFPGYSFAETYWVDDNGEAANLAACSGATPLSGVSACSYDKANGSGVVAGDTVYYRGGTYTITGTAIVPYNSGSSGNMITFSGYESETVTFSGAADVTGYNSGAININGKDYIKITKMTFTNMQTYLYITDGNYNEISYCTFQNSRNSWNDVIETGTVTNDADHYYQSGTVLYDSTKSWSTNAYVSRTLINITDGSSCYDPNSNDATTITCTSYPLYGGTNNYWSNGDSYKITYKYTYGTSYIKTTSTHNWIHHNTFNNMGAYSRADEGVALQVGIEESATDQSAYNTIENNHLYSAGHHVLGVNNCKYCVVRNNYIHNEPWYSDDLGGTCSTRPAGACGYRVVSCSGHVDYSGYSLLEGNKIGYGAKDGWHLAPLGGSGSGVTLSIPSNIYRYNDHFNNAMYGLRFSSSIGNAGWNSRVYNNTFYKNGYNGDGDSLTADDYRGGIFFSDSCAKMSGVVIINNLLYDQWSESNQLSTSNYYPSIYAFSVTVRDSCDPANVIINNYTDSSSNYLASKTILGAADPLFVNPDITTPSSTTLPDLSLQVTPVQSPAIDGGTYLTQANGSGSSSTALIVDDASFFQDGTWGSALASLDADYIAIGTVTNTVQISSINYTTNTITLASAMTWADNANIWLYKKSDGTVVLLGDAPDYGAHESNDVVAPTFSSATIPEAGTTVSVVFSEAVQIGSGLSGGWTATCSGGVCTPSYASGGGTTTLVLNWNRTIVSGETVTLTYTQPGNGVEDAAGNDFATAEDQATTNNSTYTIGSPEYSIIVGTGAGMKIGTGVGMKIE